MAGKVIHKALDLGYPGNVSRSNDNIIINRRTDGVVAFGDPVILKGDNSVVAFGASNVAADFIGIAARTVKQSTDYYNAAGSYLKGEPADIVTRGSLTVELKSGTPTAGGKVYIRIEENEEIPEGVIGGFEAEADDAKTVLVPNLIFTTGIVDANGVVEVTVLTRSA